jgi:hypothetical protein
MDQASIGDLLDYLEAQGDALETFGWESRFEQYLDADEGILEHEEFSACSSRRRFRPWRIESGRTWLPRYEASMPWKTQSRR